MDQPASQQPPVVPTGFIQNEAGTLIAVYHPEAIDQYMSGGPGGPVHPSIALQSSAQTVPPAWTQYPPPPVYNAPGQGTQRLNLPPRHFPPPPQPQPRLNAGWFPTSHSAVGLAPPPPRGHAGITSSTSLQLPGPSYFRGQQDGPAQGNSSAPYRPQQGRRDNQNGNKFNPNRNNNSRQHFGRRGRGSTNPPAYGESHHHAVCSPPFANSTSTSGIPGDWNQWIH